MKYLHLLERVYNTPLLVTPEKLAVIASVLHARAGVEPVLGGDGGDGPAAAAIAPGSTLSRDGGYIVSQSGVASVPVTGTLVHRKGGFLRPESGMQSYDGIAHMFRAALADPGVREIVLDLDSPGGEAQAVFDLADEIYRSRGAKPITALCNETACSAAYLLASAADRVLVTQSARVGSIGVVARHADLSRANDAEGLRVTYVYAGAHKVDGNPDEPLSGAALASIRARVDAAYAQFVGAVALYRGLDAAQVRGTEAAVYVGAEAVAAGLADGVVKAANVYRDGAAMVDADHTGIRACAPATENNEDFTMLDAVKKMLGIKPKDGETAEAAQQRLESLAAAFAHNPEYARAAFAAGHDVPAAVAALEAQHAAGLEAKQAELAKLGDENTQLVAAKAELGERCVKLEASVKDALARPPVSIGKGAESAEGSAEAEFASSKDLQKEFGTLVAYQAYLAAHSGGRARIMHRAPPASE